MSVGKQLQEAFTGMGTDKENNITEYFKTFQAKIKTRERLPQSIVDKYDKEIYFVIKKDEIWMEAILPRTIWVTKMGYEVDVNIIETYAKALLEAPKEPTEEVFGNAETIKSGVQTLKQRRKIHKECNKTSKGNQIKNH